MKTRIWRGDILVIIKLMDYFQFSIFFHNLCGGGFYPKFCGERAPEKHFWESW